MFIRFTYVLGFICLLTATPFLRGQTRLIPHVTASGGVFETQIIIVNHSSTPQSFTLTGFNREGEKAATVNDAVIDSQTTFIATPEELFQTNTISHFRISQDSKVSITVAYKADKVSAGPVHVGETVRSSTVFRLFQGDETLTWDGIAVVNLGGEATQVVITQINEHGETLDSLNDPFGGDLAAGAKGLSVLSSHFNAVPGSSLEIRSQQPIALVALRGTLSSEFLWENSAILVE